MSIYPLLTTKLTLPPQGASLLDRQDLRQRLDEVNQYTLTILSAPAGFGKTTLLASWAATCSERVAWISLDASENDPLLFWRYFATACQQMHDLERQVAPVLQQSGPLDVEALLVVLINTLAHASSPLLLILDDYHIITEPKIHQQMTFLTALDEEHTWYRYHHLFADVLKHRLYKCQSKERIAQFCRRVCSWYLQHDLLLDAVEVAVLAEDYTQAADLLKQQGVPIAQGYPYTRFIAWIEQFPASILTQHPDLANWYASALMMLGKLCQLDYVQASAAQGFAAFLMGWCERASVLNHGTSSRR